MIKNTHILTVTRAELVSNYSACILDIIEDTKNEPDGPMASFDQLGALASAPDLLTAFKDGMSPCILPTALFSTIEQLHDNKTPFVLIVEGVTDIFAAINGNDINY